MTDKYKQTHTNGDQQVLKIAIVGGGLVSKFSNS
jgi:hypothetical protein